MLILPVPVISLLFKSKLPPSLGVVSNTKSLSTPVGLLPSPLGRVAVSVPFTVTSPPNVPPALLLTVSSMIDIGNGFSYITHQLSFLVAIHTYVIISLSSIYIGCSPAT